MLNAVVKTSINEINIGCRTYIRVATNLKPKSKVAKDYANDNTGKHTHVADQSCIEKDCETKKCQELCDQPNTLKILGHNTHKLPTGRFGRFISETDAKGEDKLQYFVKTNKKSEMSEQDKQNYGKDIKFDTKQQTFVEKHHDKYD